MQAFQQGTPAWQQPAMQFAQNPYSGPQFQQEQQMGTRQAQNMGQTGMSNISRNITGSGMGGGNMSPFALEMMQNQGRANSGMQAQLGFMNPMAQAGQRQQQAMSLLQGYRPLQTGGTQTQSTGGLGTWLPQLIGAGMGAAGGMMGGGGAAGFFKGASAHPGGFSQPFGGGGGFGGGQGGGMPDMGMPGFMGSMPFPGMNQGFGGQGGPGGGPQGSSWWGGGS